MDEESMVLWRDVLDEIAAGRPGDLACPHCSARPLSVGERDGVTRIACSSCERFVEGRFGSS